MESNVIAQNNANFSDKRHHKLNSSTLNEFRKIVRKSLGEIDKGEADIFYTIPEEVWENIFQTNFAGDIEFARLQILNYNSSATHRQNAKISELMTYIDNYHISVNLIEKALANEQHIIIITDTDNDGSFAQSIAYSMRDMLSDDENALFHIEYARAVEGNKTRGFTSDLVAHLLQEYNINDNKCLIITADNGINSLKEQRKINALFPNATLLITDHHNPEEGMCIEENDKTYVFNPHYFADVHNPDIFNVRERRKENIALAGKGNYKKDKLEESREFMSKYNVSGATTLGLLFKQVIYNRRPELPKSPDNDSLMEHQIYLNYERGVISRIDELSNISNMLDYVNTHPDHKPMAMDVIKEGLELQGLLNTVNSMNLLITNSIDESIVDMLNSKPLFNNNQKFDINVILEENVNAQSLNVMARMLLSSFSNYNNAPQLEKDNWDKANSPSKDIVNLIRGLVDDTDFTYGNSNPNYVEQLRPIIYHLMVADKNNYEQALYKEMKRIFQELQKSEKRIMGELRKIALMENYQSNNVSISILNSDAQRVFNRKLLNKAYNVANNGFMMTLDNTNEAVISGSFRSTYDISDILSKKTKKQLEKSLKVKIETPGHERAAGFIIANQDKNAVFTPERTKEIIETIGKSLNASIEELKTGVNKELTKDIAIVSDMDSLSILSKINRNVRGMVSHFSRITPLIQLNPEVTVSVNPNTGKQTSLLDIAEERPFGWTPLTVRISNRDGSDGVVVIVPNSVLSKLSENDFKDHIRLNYMADGALIFDRLIPQHEFEMSNAPIVKFTKNSEGANQLIKFFENQTTSETYVEKLSNDDLQKLPFFMYSSNGERDFNRYQALVIETMQKTGMKYSTVMDVEATGFANANIFNIGFLTYMVDENSGFKAKADDVKVQICNPAQDNLIYLVKENALEELIKSGQLKKINEPNDSFIVPVQILIDGKHEDYTWDNNGLDGLNDLSNNPITRLIDKGQAVEVFSEVVNENNDFIYNQKIVAENVSFLIKPDTFIIPDSIQKLTNIDNRMVWLYGKDIKEVDSFVYNYFVEKQKDGGILFTAHNTSYDANIIRTNFKQIPTLFTNGINLLNDSMVLARENQLLYFNTDIITFRGIPELNEVYFYAPNNGSWGLKQMLEHEGSAEIMDIKGRYTLSKEFNQIKGSYDYAIRDSYDGSNTLINLNFHRDELERNPENGFSEMEKLLDNVTDNKFINQPIIKVDLIDFVKKADYKIIGNDISVKTDRLTQEQKYSFENKNKLPISAEFREISGNMIGSNANGLGETLVINIFADWLVQNRQVEKKLLNVNNYPIIGNKLADEMNFIMQNYDFKLSINDNLKQLFDEFPLSPLSAFFDEEMIDSFNYLSENDRNEFNIKYPEINEYIKNHNGDGGDNYNYKVTMKMAEIFLRDFVSINKELSQVYDNRWIYKAVLKEFEPQMMSDLNNANYQNISYNTGFPVELVKEVLNDGFRFKQAFKKAGCESILQVEQHNNGISTGNYAGDIVFEAVAVGLNAINKMGIYRTVEQINKISKKFTASLLPKTYNSYHTPYNTMSFRQQEMFANLTDDKKSELMGSLIERKAQAEAGINQHHIVHFKLPLNTLDDKKLIYAVVKPNVVLDESQIDEDVAKLRFLMQIQQMIHNKDENKVIPTIMDCNFEKAMDYRRDLETRYAHIEMNEGAVKFDDYQKTLTSCLSKNLYWKSNEHINNDIKLEKQRFFNFENHFLEIVKNAAIKPPKRAGVNYSQMISKDSFEFVQDHLDKQLVFELKNTLLSMNRNQKNVTHDIVILQESINNGTIKNIEPNTLRNKLSKDVLHVLKEFEDLKTASDEQMYQRFGLRKNEENISINPDSKKEKPSEVQDTYDCLMKLIQPTNLDKYPELIKVIGLSVINNTTIRSHNLNPRRLDYIVNVLNDTSLSEKERHEKMYSHPSMSDWGAVRNDKQIFGQHFLPLDSFINRTSIDSHLMEKLSPIGLGGGAIHDFYVSGIKELPIHKIQKQLELKQNRELSESMLNVENNKSTTIEAVEINENSTKPKRGRKKNISS